MYDEHANMSFLFFKKLEGGNVVKSNYSFPLNKTKTFPSSRREKEIQRSINVVISC